MSFASLYKQKRKAMSALRKFEMTAENCTRAVLGKPQLQDRWIGLRKRFGKLFPPFYPSPRPAATNIYERIFEKNTKESDVFRIVVSFTLCQIVGVLLFVITAIKYSSFPGQVGVYISLIVQIITGLMLAFPNLRGVILLALPILTTAKLRNIIILLIMSWSFQYSAMNITKNMMMLAESVGCIRSNAINTTNEVIDEANRQSNKFKLSDIKSVSYAFNKGIFKFRETLKKFQGTIERMLKGTKDYFRQVLGVKDRCERFFVGPYYYCLESVENGYYWCMAKPALRITQACGIVKALKPVCSVARFSELVCVLPGKMKNMLKNGALSFLKNKLSNALPQAVREFDFGIFPFHINISKEHRSKGNTPFGVNLEVARRSKTTNSVMLYTVKEALKDEFKTYKVIIECIVSYFDIMLAFLLILPLLSAGKYAIDFNRAEKTDNFYITDTFRDIDKVREAKGEPTLLPLLPKEKSKYIQGLTLHMTAAEKLYVIVTIVLTLVSAIIPCILIAIDVVTYRVIQEGYAFFRSNHTRTEQLDHYRMKISGRGIASEFLSRILEIFSPIANSKENDNNWRYCFKEPFPPNYPLFQVIVLLYIMSLILCFVQVYVYRLRHCMAEHYWPDKIKPRALYLYSKLLENRQSVLAQTIKAAKRKELEEELATDELAGRGDIINRGLPIFGADQYACVRCGRPDLSISDARNARICPSCNSLYCMDCYTVRKLCVDCGWSLQVISQDVEFYYDSSCDEDEYSTKGTTEDIHDSDKRA